MLLEYFFLFRTVYNFVPSQGIQRASNIQAEFI